MKTLKLRLTLDVEIDPQGQTADDCKQYLHRMLNHGIANGLLTGDSPATVEHYKFKVVTIKPKRKVKPYYPLDEQQRRDEKHGLFGDKEDIAN